MGQAVISRPILFSGPMVRAILAGRKTQTRRIVKPQPPSKKWLINTARTGQDVGLCNDHGKWRMSGAVGVARDAMGDQWPKNHEWKCPCGNSGDRLWVRENWTPDHAAFYPNFPICYQADFGPEYERENGKVFSSEQNEWYPFRWRPSIHMPRRFSRITLEIVGVRVERLNAISDDDAKAEGVEPVKGVYVFPHKTAFHDLWDSISGDGAWNENPFVWVIEFKVVTEC